MVLTLTVEIVIIGKLDLVIIRWKSTTNSNGGRSLWRGSWELIDITTDNGERPPVSLPTSTLFAETNKVRYISEFYRVVIVQGLDHYKILRMKSIRHRPCQAFPSVQLLAPQRTAQEALNN